MTPRLYLPGAHQRGDEIELDDAARHYALQVLRLGVDDRLQIFDGEGTRFDATLITATRHAGRLRIDDGGLTEVPANLRVTLMQAVSAAEKMDWTIEKAVELGVAHIIPVAGARSQVKLDASRAQRRHEHWQRLIVAACMQCGRDRLPTLAGLTTADSALSSGNSSAEPSVEPSAVPSAGAPASHRLVLTPRARTPSAQRLSAWMRDRADAGVSDVTLLIGPESGLAEAEVTDALAAGFVAIDLGPRVLRTETAGLAVLAALQARFGDL